MLLDEKIYKGVAAIPERTFFKQKMTERLV